jgi:hypothetical protein
MKMKDRDFIKLVASYAAAEARKDAANAAIQKLIVEPAIALFEAGKALEGMRLLKAMPCDTAEVPILISKIMENQWWDFKKNPLHGILSSGLTPDQEAAKKEFTAASAAFSEVLKTLSEAAPTRAAAIVKEQGVEQAEAFCKTLPPGVVFAFARDAVRQASSPLPSPG